MTVATPTTLADPLVLDGVVKRYPEFTLSTDLRIPCGLVTGFVGANGSGKTTTIKCALGLVRPDAGAVHLIDKSRVGVVLDAPAYHPRWTVAQTGRLLAGFYPTWDARRFAQLTQDWGVPATRRVAELSRGMSMKLQLAVALSHAAELLILDEPTSGLDPLSRDELLDVLADFMVDETHTVLFSSHITTDLERIADHIVVLDAGHVAASGPRDELLETFRLAAGGPGDDLAHLEPHLLGLRRHPTGWDALVRTDDAAALPAGTQFNAPTLDDLVVRIAKEHRHA